MDEKKPRFDFFLVFPLTIGLFLTVWFIIFGLMRVLDMLLF